MIIDIALLLFALAGFWVGYTKGIVSTLFSILGYIIALLITLKISPWFTDFLISSFNIEKMFALVFGTLFILIVLIFLIRALLKKVTTYLEQSKSTPHAGGGPFGQFLPGDLGVVTDIHREGLGIKEDILDPGGVGIVGPQLQQG